MEKQKIETELTLAYEDAVAYMEDLLASFRAGKIVVSRDQESVELSPAANVTVEISAKRKKNKAKFSFELSWVEEQGAPLTITETAPETPAAEHPAAQTPAAETPDAETPDAQEAAPKKKAATARKPAARKPAPKKTAARKGTGTKA